MPAKKTRRSKKSSYPPGLFDAEAAYAQSIVSGALGDQSASIEALERSLYFMPGYAPAILSMGSVEYQRGRRAKGKRLFLSLLALQWDTADLCKIIDEAGDFLIQMENYADGLELYREAARAFPDVAVFHQGIGYCADKEGLMDEALAASQRAVELQPENAAYVSDLGWTLVRAERYPEAEEMFHRALGIDPSNERAKANLDYCKKKMAKRPRQRDRSSF